MTRARDLAAGTFELATGGVLKLETSDTTVTDGSVLGKIEFKAPDEASGTDAILVGAAIEAVAEGTFAADNNATELVFKTGASAAADAKMTLTSGGNLLVGKTATGGNTAGMQIIKGSFFSHVRDGGVVQVLNRKSSYGDILSFEKDNTTRGSIGVNHDVVQYSGTLKASFGAGDVGLFANSDNDAVYPVVQTTLSGRDNAINLGLSTVRWKDLYLSGGVFLGGTGAANKLTDYEEGTWTPVLKDGNSTVIATTSVVATYTKIGRTVHLTARITRDDTQSLTDIINVRGLPFNAGAYDNTMGGTFWVDNATGDLTGPIYTFPSADRLYLKKAVGDEYVDSNELINGRSIYFTHTYFV